MIKIDRKDRILLYELMRNCRQSYRQLAKKTGISKQMVHYRISRLAKLKILKDTILRLDVGRLGYQNYFVYFQWEDRELENDMVSDILKHPSLRYAAEGSGKIGFIVTFLANDPMEFQRIWDGLTSKYGDAIRSQSTLVITEYHSFSRSALIGERTDNYTASLLSGKERIKTDDTDLRILNVLLRNARLPWTTIAEESGLSVETVKSRIKRMERDGLIQGYGWLYDNEALGLKWYECPLSLTNMGQDTWKLLFGYCKSNPNIAYFVRTIGKYEAVILFEVKDDNEFDKELQKLHRKFSRHIHDFEIIKIVKEYKFRYANLPSP